MFTNPSTNDVATYIIKNGTTEVLSNNHSGGGNSNGHQWNDITVHAIVNMAVNDWSVLVWLQIVQQLVTSMVQLEVNMVLSLVS